MKIGIFYNEKQVEKALAYRLAERLLSRGCETLVFTREDDIKAVDRLIVMGGDGTILRVARKAAEESIPLFGVNYGHIGFLTEFERDEETNILSLALSESCDVVSRSMLEVEWNGTRTVCLNDCTLLRSVSPVDENKVVKVRICIDGSDAGEITADGVIVATPTGSTAYSMSAGGSIMTPDCNTFMLTPVCAFSLKSRPIVYDAESVLTFSFPEEHRLILYGDGRFLGEVGKNDTVFVRKAVRCAMFLTRDKKSYFRKITEKIK